MSFLGFMRSRLWELAFLAIASSALAFTLFSAFYATQPLQDFPWAIAAACTAGCAVLVGCAYSKNTALIGGVVVALGVGAALFACAAASPYETPLEDGAGNYVYAVLLAAVSVAGVFVLSRTRPGAVVALVAGVFTCALIEYLYWYGHVGALALYLLGAVGLIACAGYRRSLASSDAGDVAVMPVALVAAGLSAMAIAAACAVFFGLIAPASPPHLEVKLVVENLRIEEIHLMGTGSTTDDQSGESGSLAGDEEAPGEDASDQWYDAFQNGLADLLGMNDDDTGDEGTSTMLLAPSLLALIIAALIILLVVAAILLKKLQRRLRHSRMVRPGGRQAVENLYLFFLDRLEKVKVVRPENLSVGEFARSFAGQLAAFEGGASDGKNPAFVQLTDIYERAVFGEEPLEDGELEAFERYYATFYANLCRTMGRTRYGLRFFFL